MKDLNSSRKMAALKISKRSSIYAAVFLLISLVMPMGPHVEAGSVLAIITVFGALVGIATYCMIWLVEEFVRFVVYSFTKEPGTVWDNKSANKEVRLMKSFANWTSALLVIFVASAFIFNLGNAVENAKSDSSAQVFLHLGLLPILSIFGLFLGFLLYVISGVIRAASSLGQRPEVKEHTSKITEVAMSSMEKASDTFNAIKNHEYRK